ncbi:uncharacterized protein LOC122262585 [Penaeus japonicus]|uniref:uncharacterized protein LOC122262585 n=1 Tax=Penaeus japonicus TaxID=27405 RepID=UPI001C70E79B|nr:uncharacterized protein LOC122262585 [Penaeus japonicus]
MISYAFDSPCSPTDIRLFFKKPKARRALSELGPNDPKANLRMAESLITISTEQFMKKWNFDPIRCQPLPSGRYQWTPVKTIKKRQSRETLDASHGCHHETTYDPCQSTRLSPVSHCSSSLSTTSPCDSEAGLNTSPLQELDRHLSEAPSHLPHTPKKTSKHKSGPVTPKTKQCKITDYGRQRKRLHSTSKSEEGESEVTPRKKPALSPNSDSE